MTDIDALSAVAYASGKDPLTVAERWINLLLDARDTMRQRAANGLPPLPGWDDTGNAAVARKAIGRLLDAGWHPPTEAEVGAAVRESRVASDQFSAWLDALSPDQRHDVLDHYAHHGEFPPDMQPPKAMAS